MQIVRTQIRRQHSAGFVAVLAQRIDMNHAMLYQREVSFNSSVHHFGDVMCLQQGKVILDADFNININTAAEKATVQTVEMLYTWNAGNKLFHSSCCFLITAAVNHLIHRILEYFVGSI